METLGVARGPRIHRSTRGAILALACVVGVGHGDVAGAHSAALADYLFTGQTPHPAVARIVAAEGDGTSMGSGVLVDVNATQGLVLTNWHVVRGTTSSVLVQFPDGFQSAGTVIRTDDAWDLAAIVIWRPPAAPVTLAASDPVVGEPLTIAGFGRGSYREQTGPCTDYLAPGTGYPREFLELQATARQGDSGGAIFNERRELAGVLFGEADGRTIGSCAGRVRAFLASAGSRGFVPAAPAGAPPRSSVALASAPADETIQRAAAHVPAPLVAPPNLPAAPPADAWSDFAQAAGPLAVRLVRAATTDGQMLLSAAGGLALVVFGVRVVFGGRRRAA